MAQQNIAHNLQTLHLGPRRGTSEALSPASTLAPSPTPHGSAYRPPAPELQAALAVAAAVLRDIVERWPGLARARDLNLDAPTVERWARDMLADGVVPNDVLAAWGRMRPGLTYPPDLGVLLAEASSRGITIERARQSFSSACRVAHTSEWHALTRLEIWAGRQWGWWELRHAQAGDAQVERWRALLVEAAGIPSADLPEVPQPAQRIAAVEVPEERERRRAIARENLSKIRQMLSMRP